MGVDLRKKLNLMKSLITIFVLITAILFIPSCSSDPCEEISCLNGGICTEGTCDCPPGWSGDDCSVVDFDFVGRFTSISFSFTECTDASSNRLIEADSNNEFCLVNADNNQECLRITLILEENNQARFLQIENLTIGGIQLSTPTIFEGTFTTNNELITFVAEDNAGTLEFTVTDDRTGIEWIQPNSAGDGCVITHAMPRE